MLGLFPRERCHFLLDEDLRYRHDTALENLCQFLGSAPADQPIRTKVKYFRSDPALVHPHAADIAYLNTLYRDDIIDTAELIGRDLSHWLDQPATA